MIQDAEIRKILNGAIDRVGLEPDRERMARYVVSLLVPEVKKLLKEEEREIKSRGEKS